jgi:hypothetical protein
VVGKCGEVVEKCGEVVGKCGEKLSGGEVYGTLSPSFHYFTTSPHPFTTLFLSFFFQKQATK